MLTREERLNIEKIGIPFAVAIIGREWQIPIGNLELVVDEARQYKGIDYEIKTNQGQTIYIDTKHQAQVNRNQKRTAYGVDILSMEVRKECGLKGWGIDNNLYTDYLIYMVNGVGYYILDSKLLRSYLSKTYASYEYAYKPIGKSDYRAVPVLDLLENGIVVSYREWNEVTSTRTIHPNDLMNSRTRPLHRLPF